jgi:hypothetical protein
MTASQKSPLSVEEQGATLGALQPVYCALVREFVIDIPPCPIEEHFSPTPDSVAQAAAWFQQVDARIQVHQLRQFLQTTPLASEGVLRHLLSHHIHKATKSSSDRDKTDFLLVQYFSLCAPSGLEDTDLDLAYVAQVLEPVLGPQQPKLPDWLSPLETILQTAFHCRRLSELLHSGTLEQGRKLKTQNAARYFDPSAMIAFARFSFMIRRTFFRLMQDDLNSIQDGLRELDHRAVSTVDCRRAQFGPEEPISRLRMICQSWKVMFHAEYSSGQPLRMLVDLRAAVDDALQGAVGDMSTAGETNALGEQGAAGKKKLARAASASSESGSST